MNADPPNFSIRRTLKHLYRLFTWSYPKLIGIAALWNTKARLWTTGRKHVFQTMARSMAEAGHQAPIWFHCASLGEFEQAKPLIVSLKANHPAIPVLVTFFSPSGYVPSKDYPFADLVFYLPMDSPKNAKLFFDIVNPSIVVFVKYEFWGGYLFEARKRKVPLVLISGVFRESQVFFKAYGGYYRRMLACFDRIFLQDKSSKSLLDKIGLGEKAVVSGDTRFDRVIEIAKTDWQHPEIDFFLADGPFCLVAGSTWKEDDELLATYATKNPTVKLIIAPHDVSQERIAHCSGLYPNPVLLSQLKPGSPKNNRPTGRFDTLIVDGIGLLNKLYRVGTVCYIGGGFTKDGIHNVLEATVYGKPILFGPNYSKYREARELIKTGAAISVATEEQLAGSLNKFAANNKHCLEAGRLAKDYTYENSGATEKTLRYLQENRLLTKDSK